MFLKKFEVKNYRCIKDASIYFNKGVNILIGENNSGNKRITESDCRIGTIHSVKGETFDAVLVILKKKGIGAMYKTMLRNNIKISDEEELRIVYVGITRPRRLLLLAVPDEQNKEAWEKRLFG